MTFDELLATPGSSSSSRAGRDERYALRVEPVPAVVGRSCTRRDGRAAVGVRARRVPEGEGIPRLGPGRAVAAAVPARRGARSGGRGLGGGQIARDRGAARIRRPRDGHVDSLSRRSEVEIRRTMEPRSETASRSTRRRSVSPAAAARRGVTKGLSGVARDRVGRRCRRSSPRGPASAGRGQTAKPKPRRRAKAKGRRPSKQASCPGTKAQSGKSGVSYGLS